MMPKPSVCAPMSGKTIRYSAGAVAAALLWTIPGTAQEQAPNAGPDFLEQLKVCQTKTNDSERLACFDQAVGNIVAANEAGEVQIIDQDDVRRTKRELFGLSVPDIDILKTDDEEEDKKAKEELETVITSASYQSRKKIRFTTQEGAVWEITGAPSRLRTIEAGDRVVFKKASMGTFFIRINGQVGVRGKRIQ
ncbi:MAG: hypothetical protein AAF559_09715 [Pseudomonadota bacterium]